MPGMMKSEDVAGSGCLWKIIAMLAFAGVVGGFIYMLIRFASYEA